MARRVTRRSVSPRHGSWPRLAAPWLVAKATPPLLRRSPGVVRISTFPLGVDDGRRTADELDCGVAAGRHSVFVGTAGLGLPAGRDAGAVAANGEANPCGRRERGHESHTPMAG